MGDVKDRLTEGVRQIVDSFEGRDFNEETAQEISDKICRYLWDNGLPENVIPVIDIAVDDDGYVDIQVLDYPTEEDMN